MIMPYRTLAHLCIVLASLVGLGRVASAGPQFAVAVQGYDVVSYFAAGAPAKGVFDHAVYWNGATWLFSSEANARRFEENPREYAPQFDGYCALAASLGYKAPAEALTGKIVAGKLYLNYNSRAAKLWSEDERGNIAKGEANWPKLNSF
jgi:hypothetical protein